MFACLFASRTMTSIHNSLPQTVDAFAARAGPLLHPKLSCAASRRSQANAKHSIMSFSPRASPFRRPESPVTRTPSTVRAATPTMTSPTKLQSSSRQASPMLSPERQSPFVRRPSQLAHDRPKSPFTRPASRLSVAETPQSESFPESDPFVAPSPSPVMRPSQPQLDGSSPAMSAVSSPPLPSAAPLMRPSVQRTVTSSTTATVRPTPTYTVPTSVPSRPAFTNVSGYNHVPQPLLRSMRESFEVLDSNNNGSVTSADVSALLEQLGMDNSPSTVSSFFPPNQISTLNLARFLDMLSGPMNDLSQPEELMAAFGAFDVDDSGQIDVHELRDALMHTNPELDAMGKMSEREVDNILGEFAGRRAFGGKGVLGKDIAGSGKRGEVFRYRDFMANISGASAAPQDSVPA